MLLWQVRLWSPVDDLDRSGVKGQGTRVGNMAIGLKPFQSTHILSQPLMNLCWLDINEGFALKCCFFVTYCCHQSTDQSVASVCYSDIVSELVCPMVSSNGCCEVHGKCYSTMMPCSTMNDGPSLTILTPSPMPMTMTRASERSLDAPKSPLPSHLIHDND